MGMGVQETICVDFDLINGRGLRELHIIHQPLVFLNRIGHSGMVEAQSVFPDGKGTLIALLRLEGIVFPQKEAGQGKLAFRDIRMLSAQRLFSDG